MIYTVKSGDSLSKIARDILRDISLWPQLARLNNLTSPYNIYPGQRLQLPGGMALSPVMPQLPGPVTKIVPWYRRTRLLIWISVAITGIILLTMFDKNRR